MYGVGISEIAVILLVMLLFFKPEDIFSFFRKAGQFYSRLLKVQKEMEDLIEREITDSENKEEFGFDTARKKKDTGADKKNPDIEIRRNSKDTFNPDRDIKSRILNDFYTDQITDNRLNNKEKKT